MKQYGCIGKKLTHSFSKEIHAKLADYNYELIELAEDELATFFEKKAFAAINVTIPYKQAVISYLDFISPVAERIGAVNTIVNKDGMLHGYNTDYYGMKALIEKMGVHLENKKVLILGTGGTSKTARVLAADLGAAEIVIVSRRKTEEYITYTEAVALHADAEVIINTTPSGMYPDCESKPIDISGFSSLEGVIDAVYNPLRTNLVLDAKARGIKAEGGLYMLVMQAVVAVEKFLDAKISKSTADSVFASVFAAKENIVLTGVPGNRKRTVGKHLKLDGYEFFDIDDEIEKRYGYGAEALLDLKGEALFRDIETEVIRDISSESCRIIFVRSDAMLREEYIRCLKRNGRLFFLGTGTSGLQAGEENRNCDAERLAVYEFAADSVVPDFGSAEAEAAYILEKRMELL